MTSSTVSLASYWLQTWTRPRSAVRSLIGRGATAAAILLALASGVLQSLVTGASNHVGTPYGRLVVLAIALPIGTVWGLFQLHLISGLLYLVARLTSTPIRFGDLRIAIGWSNVPLSAAFAVWVVATLLVGAPLYVDPETMVLRTPFTGLFIALLYLATAGCFVWSTVLMVFAVAEVHRISAWRAVGHLLVTVAALMAATGVTLAFVALLFWR